MSDELPAGSLSLEEPFEQQTAPPETPPAAPENAPIPAEDEPEPEGTVEIPTGKVVPLTALQAERQAKKQERESREAAEREAAEAKQKLDVIQREWQAVQPLIQQFRSQPPPAAAPPPPAKGPLSDQEAVDYARDFDLYKPDGTPDVDRAQRIAARHDAWAERKAHAAIQPIQQQTAQQYSAHYLEQAASVKDKAGQTVDRGILQAIWSQVPPEMSARPEIATLLYKLAIAESVQQGRYRGLSAPPPPPPPVHSEGLGGNAGAKPEPSAIDRRFMDASDITEKEFTAISARYKPGQRNVLE